jgi:hypothetical protein
MDAKLLKEVIAQVHRRYPEFAGIQPKVKNQVPPGGASNSAPQTVLLTFSSTAKAQSSAGSKSMPRYLRVVVNENGKILKVTTSR